MVFPVVGGDGKPTGYEIENSLRFNNNDTAYLNISRSSQSNTTGTFSVWTKMGVPSDDNVLFGGHTDVNNRSYIYFSDPDGYVGIFSRTSGSADIAYNSNGRFRDPSAWYHVVVAIDTTQGTAGNRFKMYINGTQYTDWGTATAPSQNASLPILNKAAQTVGGGYGSSSVSSMADSYLADFYYIDGQQLDASNFGETNDNGVWIPKKYLGTYGTNGFKLEFQQTGTGTASASTIGADTSGNDNHLTSNNLAATDVTTDTPTNNFCTMNPLISFAGASDGIDAFTEGNTVVDSNNDTSAAGATFGVQNGKWYYEAKLTTGNQSSTNFGTGWASTNYEGQKGTGNGVGFMSGEDNIAVDPGGNLNKGGTGSTQVFGNRSTNDIFQVAIDLDNGKIWFGVNGTWSNGSATNSTTLDASNPDYSSVFDTVGEHYMPAFGQGSSGQTVLAYNFGNPAFSISSGNADANGYGNFEYEVPSGFYSLCTKNLAEFG